jgi:hypothetical protein
MKCIIFHHNLFPKKLLYLIIVVIDSKKYTHNFFFGNKNENIHIIIKNQVKSYEKVKFS